MPKIAMATAAEAAEIRADLTAAIEALDTKMQETVGSTADQLRTELKQVADNVTSGAETAKAATARVAGDSKAFTESSIESLRRELAGMLKASEERAGLAREQLDSNIKKVDADLRVALADELGALCDQFDKQLMAQREELEAQAEKWAKEAAEAIVQQRREVDTSIVELQTNAQAWIEESYQKTFQQAEQRSEDVNKAMKEAAERSKRAEGEVYLKLGQLEDELHELQAAAREHTNQVQKGALTQVTQLRHDAETRLAGLDQEALKLRDAIAEVENLSTRRVDWVIKHVSLRLRPSTPGTKASLHTSWFSPKFNMAGAHGLQLEFQLFRPSDPPVEGEGAGDCAVFLWACKGTSLIYKLYIGKKVATMEKVFNGRVPYGTKRMCFLKDQINKEDDTLRISIEILETVREIEHPVKPPPPPEDLDELETAVQPLEGLVVFRRHINNRILDQVKKEVEIMRSRMVRRIEWRVEQASLLRRCFPPGEPMCSAPFNAAGIEGMQLMFYPAGYLGCSEGSCSVYLWAPAGTTLKCSLWAGSQRRDASHYFGEPGAFGRTNFCRFENAVDQEEDTVTLALDVEEAHQDVQATVAHPVVQPGDRRTQAQIDADLPDKVDSVVKLKRVPGKTALGMEDKRVLPNLWQAKSLSSDPVPEGFHSYDELKGKVTSCSSPVVGSVSIRRSESSPGLRDAGDRTLRIEGDSTPLPQLARTAGSEWSLDCMGTSRPARKGRLNFRKDRSGLTVGAVVH